MGKALKITIDDKLRNKNKSFIDNVGSAMYFKSEFTGESMKFEWINEFEVVCPYVDNLVRNPRVALITEEDVVKIEKAKKVSVASVKDLAKNSKRIDKIDPVTNEVKPSKLLIERREETFNTYENRFLFTVIKFAMRFVSEREEELNDLEAQHDKVLEYTASTVTGNERVNIKLKMTSNEIPKKGQKNQYEDLDFGAIRDRIKRIKDYFANWQKSEFMKSLEKARVPLVSPPIKKTNLILKNPNFQMVTRLWEFILKYDNDVKEGAKEDLETSGNSMLRELLDDAFLMNYIVLDSVSSSTKEQREKLAKYAVIAIAHQVQRIISLLLRSGIELSDEEIISMIAAEIKNIKNKSTVDNTDIKRKFQKAMEEYIEKTQEYL